jgi:hypothetical protein
MTTSSDIVSHVMSWFRFHKQFPYVADELELGRYRSDVIGANKDELIEIEVKVSRSDLAQDFNSKRAKHDVYRSGESCSKRIVVPNRFYFAVPERLKKSALEYLSSKNQDYGLIVMDDTGDINLPPYKLLSLARRAVWLHREPPSAHLLEKIVRRMGSDLASLHMMRNRYGAMFDQARAESDRIISSRPDPDSDIEESIVVFQ